MNRPPERPEPSPTSQRQMEKHHGIHEFLDVVRARAITQVLQEIKDEPLGLVAPVKEPKTVVDGYVSGKLALHLNIGLRTGPAYIDLDEFCADLHAASLDGDEGAPNLAVGRC